MNKEDVIKKNNYENDEINKKELIFILKKTAVKAGYEIMKLFNKVTFEEKEDQSLITAADKLSDKIIKKELEPLGFNIIDEESGLINNNSEYTLIIDPLDGTTNFYLGVPFFNISIALFKEKEPFLGVVFNPATKELYYGLKEEGSFLEKISFKENNGVYINYESESIIRLKVNNKEISYQNGINTFCHKNSVEEINKISKLFSYFKKNNPKFRQLGAAALELCLLAKNKTTSFIMPGINLWDVAAGAIIAEEAGIILTNFEGKKFDINSKELLASQKKNHEALLKEINEILKK